MATRTKKEVSDGVLADRLEGRDRVRDRWREGASLQRLDELVGRRAAIDEEIADAVATARAEGHSWNSIGLMLGTSKQAAQQRFG
jgi:hypothetical protein